MQVLVGLGMGSALLDTSGERLMVVLIFCWRKEFPTRMLVLILVGLGMLVVVNCNWTGLGPVSVFVGLSLFLFPGSTFMLVSFLTLFFSNESSFKNKIKKKKKKLYCKPLFNYVGRHRTIIVSFFFFFLGNSIFV